MPHNQQHWCRSLWTRQSAATLPRTVAILSPSHLQWGIRCDPHATLVCFAHGEQQTNEPQSQTLTQKSPNIRRLPLTFERPFGDWCWNQTVPHLCLCRTEETLVSFPPGWCSALSPGGKRYNEDLYVYALPHFICKRCTHPVLWTSDCCIMGSAHNMTVHHVGTAWLFSFHDRLQHFPPFVVHMDVEKQKSPKDGASNVIMGSYCMSLKISILDWFPHFYTNCIGERVQTEHYREFINS